MRQTRGEEEPTEGGMKGNRRTHSMGGGGAERRREVNGGQRKLKSGRRRRNFYNHKKVIKLQRLGQQLIKIRPESVGALLELQRNLLAC